MFLVNADHCVIAVAQTVSIKRHADGHQGIHHLLFRHSADGCDPVSDRGGGRDEAGQ